MAAQLAIDYGTDRVRLLEFDGSGRKIRVLAVTEVDLTTLQAATDDEDDTGPTSDDLMAEAIADAADEQKLVRDPSGMAWAAGQSLFREFALPFTNDDQIEKVVRFEAESHIPLDIDDVVIQHLVLRKTRDKSHILAVAVRKDDLLDRFDILEEANLDPMFVDVDVLALLNALDATGVVGEHPRFVVVDCRERATNLLFIVDGSLFAVRSLRLGAHGIPLGSEGAANSPADEIGEARAVEFLTRLEREVRRTLTTLPGLGALDAVLMMGQGTRIHGFGDALGRCFGRPAEELDLLSRVDHKLDPADVERFGPDIGVALGTAFKLAGHDPLGTDFRREECAYTKKFDQVKSPLIVLSFVLFLIVALKGIDTHFRTKKIERDYTYLLVDAQEQLNLMVGDNAEARAIWENVEFGPKRVQAISSAFDRRHNELSAQLGRSSQIPPLPSALGVWIVFSDLLVKNQDQLQRMWLHKIDIDVTARDPVMRLTGKMVDPTRYNDLIDLLSAHPMFIEVEQGDVNPSQDDEFWEFTETVVRLDLGELEGQVERWRQS